MSQSEYEQLISSNLNAYQRHIRSLLTRNNLLKRHLVARNVIILLMGIGLVLQGMS